MRDGSVFLRLPYPVRRARPAWLGCALVLCLLAGLMCLPGRAQAQDIAVQELGVDLGHDPLVATLRFSVTEAPLFADMLRNGARIEISGRILLERRRLWWTNATLAEKPFSFTLRYDPLTRSFLLQKDGGAPISSKRLAPFLEPGYLNLRLELGRRAHFEAGETYLLQATIGARQMPGTLPQAHGVFFKTETIIPDMSISMSFDGPGA